MVTKTGTTGSHGSNGANPTAGGDGGAASFTDSGMIGLDSLTYLVLGGNGGVGGNGTGDGEAGGNGGGASITLNGNIFNNPASTNLTVSMTAQGGDGGLGGTAPMGFNPGPQGNGGNATTNINGNILQPSKAMNAIDLEAVAIGGLGSVDGNATAILNGNVVQVSKATTVTLAATASAHDMGDSTFDDGDTDFGTKSATVSGNIVQGAITTATLRADAFYSNASATLSGNVVQDSATSGKVTLEATGQNIDIEKNKVTIGKNQELDLTVNQLDPVYNVIIKGNEFTGASTNNTFVFTDNGVIGTSTPNVSPTPDVVVIDLLTQDFNFDGNDNKLVNFNNVIASGNNDPTIIGDNNANILVDGGGDDILEGLGGNDTLNGGGGANTAVYQGAYSQYSLSFVQTGSLPGTVTDTVAGRDGTDTLTNIQYLQFTDGTYNVTTGVFVPNAGTMNHAPAGTNGTVTTLEDTAYTFKAADFGFTDPNDSPANALLAVEITTLPTNGALTDNGVAVTAGQFVSAADIAANKLVFTPAANANGTGYTNFTFQVQDNGGTAGGGVDTDQSPNTLTINVTSVNDAPAGTNGTVTTLEDTAYTFKAADFGFTDPNDSPANALLAVEITTLPTNGSLTDNGVAVTAGQFISAADIAANKLVFTPAANANGNGYTNFTFQVQDNGGAANGGVDTDQTPNTLTINVTSVNDAPAGADKSIATPLNTPYIFTASDFGFTDTNDSPSNNFLDVKITNIPFTSATGQLLDNGVVLSSGAVVSVSDINSGKLEFIPATGGNGAGYAAFTFQVQDDGGTANGGVDMDQSPNTITFNVGLTNHAPAGTNGTVTTLEDTAYTFKAADFGFTDPNDAPPNALLAVEISTLPTNGTLTDNGVAVTAGQFVSAVDIAANKLVFTPAANANGTGYTSFTFQVQDNGGTAGGGVDTDQSPNSLTINVTSVNDAPAGTNGTVTTLEDTAYTFKAADFGFTDPNDSPANALLAVEITTLPVNGTLTDNGVAVTAGQFVSATDIAANKLVFTPAANANGTGYTNFTFQVQDNGGTANGGVDTDQSPNTLTINVTSVNDAPAGTNGTVTTLEDTAYTFKAADFGFTDPNDSPANALLAVEITTLPTNGALTDNGVAVTAGQFVSATDIAANKLVFTPAANANGTGYTNFTFQVQDNGGTANGGVDTDPSPNTLTINVTSVNDAPAGTNGTVTTLEDTAYTFKAADFGFTDPNDSPANALLAVEITTLPTNGALTDNGVAVAAGQFVSAADIAANKLVFTPAANANGTGYTNFTFQVQDNGGTANGGVDTDQSPNTLTINVTSVNDAPAGTTGTVTTLEDTDYTFKAADFGFTDPNDSPANALLAVEITTLPVNGSLTDNGVAVTAGQFVSAADIAANKLVFTPAANANGNGYASFTFQVEDDGGTTNGGINLDPTAKTLTVNVTPVNDAPVGTTGTITTLEDTAYTFKAADFGFTDPNDSPADALLAVEITTLPTNGALTDNGVAVTAGQLVSAADIAANKLVFTPAANANGAGYANFTFQVEDNGGTANGGNNLDPTPKTLTVNVTSVNDAPSGADNTVSTLISTPYTFAASDFGFSDANDSPPNALLAVEITTLPANGALTDNGVAVTAGQFVSAADINNGLLKFTPVNGAMGANYANFTFQVEDNGGTANGGANLDPTPKTMKVNVAPPLFVGPGGFSSINAAIAAANPGDTIVIAPGTYNENVIVNKAGITLLGQGPGVIIEGTFSQTNGNFAGPLATWLQTATSYSGASGTGVTISADNVTLNNITVGNFLTGVAVSGASVSGLTLNGVTMQDSVIGFSKPDDTALNNANITNSTFSDEYIGAGFFNDQGATGGAGAGKDATNTSITNSDFQNIDTKGIYMETAQGNTTLDGLTMNNVGEYGSVPSFGANGLNGNAIDINLKYHTYSGNLDISDFDLTNTGGSAGQNGAIVVEGRDDPSYSSLPADVSSLNVTIQDGTIDGTTTGIRAGEIKSNPSQNDTGPAVTVTNVIITNTTVGAIDNNTDSLMTVNGTTGDDDYVSPLLPGATGSLVINGLGGNNTLGGGLGNDTLNGGAGNDTLLASGGDDVLNGGGGNNTADFSQATNGVTVSTAITGLQNLGDFGEITLANIQNLTGSNFSDVLTGDAGNNILQGGGGDDTLVASAGKDLLDGGAGTNTADFSAFSGGVTVTLTAAGYQNFDGAAGDQSKLANIQNLIGGAGNDILTGNSGNNILIGGAGDDVLSGGGGTLDIYQGGLGNDTINGTSGSTTDVAYYSGLGTASTITGSLGGTNVHVVGPDGTDTLNRVDRVKFLSPTHVSDLDNNGTGDLVFQDHSTGTIVTVNNPAGTLNTLTASPASNWSAVGTGMFNPDAAGSTARKAGILLQNTAAGAGNGDLEIITSISGSSSSAAIPLSSATGAFTGYTAITAGDFNGDAASDILLWNGATQTAEIAFLNQNVGETVGTVDAVTTISGAPTGGNWAPVASGDFNGDGKSDILWQNGVGGAVQISLMNGATITNTDTVVLNTAPGFKAVGTGDFDGDGKSDILFATGGAGSAAEIWTINGDSVTNTFDINAPTSGASGAGTFTLMGAEDINADGFSDLLWQNTSNGDVVAQEMSAGGNVLSTVNLGAPASNFHLVASTGGG